MRRAVVCSFPEITLLSHWRFLLRVCQAALLVLLINVPMARADVAEYELKTAFLYHFALFTDWPVEVIGSSYTFCILGKAPFGPALDALREKSIKGRAVKVLRQPNPEDFKQCQVLFISDSEKANLPQLVGQLAGLPILTIVEGDTGQQQQGVAINLIWDKNRIIFEVNSAAVGRAKLAISSKLLRLAKEVR